MKRYYWSGYEAFYSGWWLHECPYEGPWAAAWRAGWQWANRDPFTK